MQDICSKVNDLQLAVPHEMKHCYMRQYYRSRDWNVLDSTHFLKFD